MVKLAIFLSLSLFIFSNFNRTPPRVHTVEITGMRFLPAELKIRKGDTVVWINKDLVAHTVSDESKGWTSPIIRAGESWKTTVNVSTRYFCSIHPVMKGQIAFE